MKKVLSYCFFEPKVLPTHRFWDKDFDKQNRYYYNVPSVIMCNNLLFPEYTTRIYVTSNTFNNPLSQIFKLTSFKDLNLEIVELDIMYELTEPTIFRMQPVWEDGVDIVHTRDIDSVPTEAEYRYLTVFEKLDKYAVGTLRTHQNHYGAGCCMLAGLSSFRPSLIPEYIKGNSFGEYYASRHDRYGMDQDLMISYFTKDYEFTQDKFLDCAAQSQSRGQDFPCDSIRNGGLFSFKLDPDVQILLDKIDEFGYNNWAGEPVDCRQNLMPYLLAKFPLIEKEMKSFIDIEEFYL